MRNENMDPYRLLHTCPQISSHRPHRPSISWWTLSSMQERSSSASYASSVKNCTDSSMGTSMYDLRHRRMGCPCSSVHTSSYVSIHLPSVVKTSENRLPDPASTNCSALRFTYSTKPSRALQRTSSPMSPR